MTFVVELRDLRKNLPRPISHLWQRATEALCVSRVRLLCLGLLAVALGYPVDPAGAPREGVLGMLCALLMALVSATNGLLCDASSGASALFGDHESSAFKLSQCFDEPLFPLGISPAAAAFPTFSGHAAFALAACALFLFGCGFGRRESAKPCRGR
jgi:hypothetical protein